jgi:hypothetical protein
VATVAESLDKRLHSLMPINAAVVTRNEMVPLRRQNSSFWSWVSLKVRDREVVTRGFWDQLSRSRLRRLRLLQLYRDRGDRRVILRIS